MTKFRSALTLAAALGLAGALSGCAGAVVGAGATAGVAAAEERGLDGAVDDTKIRAEINHYWFQHDVEMYRKVGLTISEGRVLLTGVVPTDAGRADAVRLAWQAAGVREVINEIAVRPDGTDQNRPQTQAAEPEGDVGPHSPAPDLQLLDQERQRDLVELPADQGVGEPPLEGHEVVGGDRAGDDDAHGTPLGRSGRRRANTTRG